MNNNTTPRLVASLPRTIDGAKIRYLKNYQQQFRGDLSECKRLVDKTNAKFIALRLSCPNFYETKLPQLVNQVASKLLIPSVNTSKGQADFNQIHKRFLQILDELIRSQPSGEVNFDKESDRLDEREKIYLRAEQLRQEIEILEASTVECSQIGRDDQNDSEVDKLFDTIFKKKKECEFLLKKIAAMEGEQVEQDFGIDFELRFKDNSKLAKLDPDKHEYIEKQIKQFLNVNRAKNFEDRRPFDPQLIEDIINRLDLPETNFNKDDKMLLTSEILRAYRTYFRELEIKRRNESLNYILSNEVLRPKEGIILESPDDVPLAIEQKFVEHEQIYKAGLEFLDRTFCTKEEAQGEIDENPTDEEEHDSIDEEGEARAKEELRKFQEAFPRVKEEPKQDYEDELEAMLENDQTGSYDYQGSDQAVGQLTPDNKADNKVPINDQQASIKKMTPLWSGTTITKDESKNSVKIIMLPIESVPKIDSAVENGTNMPNKKPKLDSDRPPDAPLPNYVQIDNESNGNFSQANDHVKKTNENNDDDGDIVDLGIVEPKQKVITITLSDDDD